MKKAKEKAAFKCPECSRVFALKNNLKKHIEAVHEGKKPFVCPRKSSRFARKQDLNRHVKAVHEGVKQADQKAKLGTKKALSNVRFVAKYLTVSTA